MLSTAQLARLRSNAEAAEFCARLRVTEAESYVGSDLMRGYKAAIGRAASAQAVEARAKYEAAR